MGYEDVCWLPIHAKSVVAVGGTPDGGAYEAIHARGICPEGRSGAHSLVYDPHGLVLRTNK